MSAHGTPQDPRAARPAFGRSARGRLRAAWIALGLLAVLAAVDAWRWRDKARDNEAIAAGVVVAPERNARPALRFAHAHALGLAGKHEDAVDAYRLLQGKDALGEAARYNAANQLLRQAVVMRASPLPGQALPLIELAKTLYREVLRTDPEHWEARYNLERAQRMQPDPEPSDNTAAGPPEDAERAATTMRGISRGLP